MKPPNYFTTDFPARRSRNQRPIRLATKITKMSFGFGHNRPRAYRRDAGYSIYLGFFVLLVVIDPSRLASIFEDSNTDGHGLRRQAIPVWIGGSYPGKSVKSVVKIPEPCPLRTIEIPLRA